MSLQLGIVGLPGAGKTTLFNALTGSRARTPAHAHPTQAQDTGIVQVPDGRLESLRALYQAKGTVPAAITFVDAQHLKESDHSQDGGGRLLTPVRDSDALVIVVKAFRDLLYREEGELHPLEDLEVMHRELVLADHSVVEKALEKREKGLKAGEKKYAREVVVLKKLEDCLGRGEPALALELSREETELVKAFRLLTLKPVLVVANISEKDLKLRERDEVTALRGAVERSGAPLLVMCAQVETEIAELPPEEAKAFAEELGFELDARERFITAAYRTLGIVTFFTGGDKEVRAWTIPRGTTALKGAGKIHTDMEKGFVECEVIGFDELVRCSSFDAAREAGSMRLEGREYLLQEGDVVHFRFTP